MIKRFAIAVHRWLGVTLCLLFLLWFPSGIGMMYWDFPSVTPADRLDRSPSLDSSAIRVSPSEAYAALGETPPATDVRLNTFDGRPVYRFRAGRGDSVVYADTGARQFEVSKEMMLRVASAWSGLPASTAAVTLVDVDQWTVQGSFRSLQPLWKYSWPDGQQVYVSEKSGEVVQYTTSASRLGAYLGPIPHWIYFTPLRKHQPEWSRLVIWTSGVGTFVAMLGVVIGIWMYSPSKRYRYAGTTTRIPYRGQKRWHMMLGLVFGLGAATWAFSGMLSMDPFPVERGGRPAGTGRGGGVEIAQALRGRVRLDDFARRDPRAALSQLAGANVKELALTSFAGEPAYLATLARGETRVVPLDGPARDAFDVQRIMEIARTTAGASGLAEIRVIDQYDRYYLDRRRSRPLPVIMEQLNDAEHTRYYIDPKTARVVGSYSSRNWMSRWLYHGLHSLDFPWLYNYRPAWDIVVIAFMLGGTALGVTSLVLAWRVIGRTVSRSVAASSPDDALPVS
jgi:PepSY-associated transmembrane protein